MEIYVKADKIKEVSKVCVVKFKGSGYKAEYIKKPVFNQSESRARRFRWIMVKSLLPITDRTEKLSLFQRIVERCGMQIHIIEHFHHASGQMLSYNGHTRRTERHCMDATCLQVRRSKRYKHHSMKIITMEYEFSNKTRKERGKFAL